MKAVIVREHGGFDKLLIEDLPRPQIRPDEVLIAVKAAGINHLDLWVRKGVPGHKFPLPMILGTDIAGVVAEVGSLVTNAKVGDRVAVMPGFAQPTSDEALSGNIHLARDYGIFGETRNGGCAEFMDAPAVNLMPMPDWMSFTDAAACPLVFLTAYTMLRKANVQPGETVLMHAAGSGVTSAGIQIARMFGATVITTAGSDEKLAKAKALGADYGINYRTHDFVEEAKKIAGRAGVDVVFDHIGPDTFAGNIKVLKWGGRLVTCGSTSGGEVPLNLRAVFFKRISIIGSTMGPKADQLAVWKLLCNRKLTPVVDRVFPVRDVAAAHEYVEWRKAFGKVVLDLERW
ncbi:MAG: zinc-binding dehydrogenase [Planctomycetes bacterium]|nr:zinc-binding dehydrogenase [Planctomycetota bacterium]MCW8135039.1 zinc-binding dehydrogenase [Planctomycetota bacterium]